MLSPAVFNTSLLFFFFFPSRWGLTALPTNISETNVSVGVARNALCLCGCLCSGNSHGKHTSASSWKCHQFWSVIFLPLPAPSVHLNCFAEMGSDDPICWAVSAAVDLTWSSGNRSPGDNQYWSRGAAQGWLIAKDGGLVLPPSGNGRPCCSWSRYSRDMQCFSITSCYATAFPSIHTAHISDFQHVQLNINLNDSMVSSFWGARYIVQHYKRCTDYRGRMKSEKQLFHKAIETILLWP